MSDVSSIPTGSLPRSASLDIFRQLASGASHLDPTQLFSQLKALQPPKMQVFVSGDVMGGISYDDMYRPNRVATILIANTLNVPLVQGGAPYFDCGSQYAGPDGSTIPAASADAITYGLYVFGNTVPISFYGTEGAMQLKPSGTALPFGLTLGWRVSFGDPPTYACGVSLQHETNLEKWCDTKVDDTSAHHASDAINSTRVSCAMFTTSTEGYLFLPILVEATS